MPKRASSVGRPPGYFGKLPARADFVGRRLAPRTVEAWDTWLQACLMRSQAVLGPAWEDRYLTAPPWRFALPARVCDDAVLIGVMMPSVDAVGRCFPLLLAQELPVTADTSSLATEAARWFEAAEATAFLALAENCDLALLDRPLPLPAEAAGALRVRGTAAVDPVGLWLELPALSAMRAALRASGVGQQSALWWTVGGHGFGPTLAVTTGLIEPAGFAALLDGAWADHGWHSAGGRASANTGLAWDRDG